MHSARLGLDPPGNLRLISRKMLEPPFRPQHPSCISERARHFCSGGPCSHNDEVECTFVDERGVAVGRFQDRYDPRPQYFGVTKRIEWIAVFVCSQCPEEVW